MRVTVVSSAIILSCVVSTLSCRRVAARMKGFWRTDLEEASQLYCLLDKKGI
jgi:hypothetical protein